MSDGRHQDGDAGRVAMVTGAAAGVGRAVVERFLMSGAAVVALDLQETRPRQDLAGRLVSVRGDVRKLSDLHHAVEIAEDRFGRLDVIAAVAGVLKVGDVADMSAADRDAVIGVNLIGVWNTIAAGLPLVRRSPGPRRILVCGSIASVVAGPGQAAYASAKHGLVGLVRAVALDCATEGTTVNLISPASVDTAMLRDTASVDAVTEIRATTPVGRLATAQEVAATFEFLSSAEASYVTGANIMVDGGCQAVNPHNVAAVRAKNTAICTSPPHAPDSSRGER